MDTTTYLEALRRERDWNIARGYPERNEAVEAEIMRIENTPKRRTAESVQAKRALRRTP